jgi:hypothetical protein
VERSTKQARVSCLPSWLVCSWLDSWFWLALWGLVCFGTKNWVAGVWGDQGETIVSYGANTQAVLISFEGLKQMMRPITNLNYLPLAPFVCP